MMTLLFSSDALAEESGDDEIELEQVQVPSETVEDVVAETTAAPEVNSQEVLRSILC